MVWREWFIDDADDVSRYADRIMSRCQTVEVRVLTQRDQMQEEALSQINHLIDGLVMDLRNDHEAAKLRYVMFFFFNFFSDREMVIPDVSPM